MKTLKALQLATIASASILLVACKQEAQEAKPVALDFANEKTKESYAVGFSAGKSMRGNIDSIKDTGIPLDQEIIIRAFEDGLLAEGEMEEKEVTAAIDGFRKKVSTAMQEVKKKEAEKQKKVAEENKVKGAEFLEANKAKEGVKVTESGLQYKVLTATTKEGAKSPKATDKVKVHYTGTLMDGTKFDSSRDRGQPSTFGVNRVIKGWTEALQLMKEGDRWELTIPADIAYGAVSRPKIPGNSVLVFDVELIEVLDPAAARPANPHGAANPHSKPAVNVKPKPVAKPAEK